MILDGMMLILYGPGLGVAASQPLIHVWVGWLRAASAPRLGVHVEDAL